MSSRVDDLLGFAPQSYLTPLYLPSSDRTHDAFSQPDRSLFRVPPTDWDRPRPEQELSSRRILTRAIEISCEAVKLDSTNDNAEAAVAAYVQSVALLSEVIERVKIREESTRNSHRKRRELAAKEEVLRRLQSIHDTFTDRINTFALTSALPAARMPIYSSLHKFQGRPSPMLSYATVEDTMSLRASSSCDDVSLYSVASSRTAETDYGLYYRRMALSQTSFDSTMTEIGKELRPQGVAY